MKTKVLALIITALVVILFSNCNQDKTIVNTTSDSDLSQAQITGNEKAIDIFQYSEKIKAKDIEKYTVLDFVTKKGRIRGDFDPKAEEKGVQISNTNWYTSPSLSRFLSRIVRVQSNNSIMTEDIIVFDQNVIESSFEAASTWQEAPEIQRGLEEGKETRKEESKDGANYSTTNVQVEGVDEAEIIKTDGEFIYYLSRGNGLVIIKAGKNPKQVAQINPSVEEGYPPDFKDMYISGDKLIIVASVYNSGLLSEIEDKDIYPLPSTTFFVYDVKSPTSPVLSRVVEVVGTLNTTRFFDNKVFFVTTQNYYDVDVDQSIVNVLPSYKDTILGDDTYLISPDQINILTQKYRYTTEYSMVGHFGLDDIPVKMSAYEGENSAVYMSKDSLYLANQARATYYNNEKFLITVDDLEFKTLYNIDDVNRIYYAQNDTYVNHFLIGENGFELSSMGIVPGHLINQFAMDEYEGTFRAASIDKGANSIFIFDTKKMKQVGQLTGLAPGETIRSVRFKGTTGYVVTFRQTDPLFVIDLRDPRKPILDGELKIPGFSVYLHPISKDKVIGLGYADSSEIEQYFSSGNIETIQPTGMTGGVKVSMFDVSNPKNPVELHKMIVGGMSSSSEALLNPKSIMFDSDKSIMAFPMNDVTKDSAAWNGGVVLGYGGDGGFSREADISLGNSYGAGSRFVFIGDVLYYVCENDLVAIDYNDYTVISQIKFDFN